MSPFEALYGRKCRTPLYWNQTGETQVFGLDVLRDAEEQVRMIIDNLRVAQSRQKSYAHTHRRELTFEVGDYVYLKVSPMRSVKRFNIAERTKATTIASAASSDRSLGLGEFTCTLSLPRCSQMCKPRPIERVSRSPARFLPSSMVPRCRSTVPSRRPPFLSPPL
jgi:hypothetical protein